MLTEEITSGQNTHHTNFSVPISEIPSDLLHGIARKRNLNSAYLPEGTDVKYWEIESALENSDDRRDHGRALDAAVEKAVELYDDRSYDLILKNVDYDLRDHIDDSKGRKPRSDKWYYGEIDLMLVDVDENWVRGFEVKPRRGLPLDHNGNYIYEAPSHEQKVDEQFRRHSFAFDFLNEKLDDFGMHYIPESGIYETDLSPESEIPDKWEGDHYWDEKAKEKAYDSDRFRAFLDEFVLPQNPLIMSSEKMLEREEVNRGDFIEEYLRKD